MHKKLLLPWLKIMQWRSKKLLSLGQSVVDAAIIRSLQISILEGRRVNRTSIMHDTGLPKTSVNRRLAALEKAGRVTLKPQLGLTVEQMAAESRLDLRMIRKMVTILTQNGPQRS